MTVRKGMHLIRDEGRQKRNTVGNPAGDSGELLALDELISQEPGPETAAQMAEDYQRLLGSLADPELKSVAVWKMHGYTVEQIAAKLRDSGPVSARTVKRKLDLIRRIWEKEIGL